MLLSRDHDVVHTRRDQSQRESAPPAVKNVIVAAEVRPPQRRRRRELVHNEYGDPFPDPPRTHRRLMASGDLPLDRPARRSALIAASPRGRVDRSVGRGQAERPHHGIYAPPGFTRTASGKALAALATESKAAASHWTAVGLYGWELLDPAPEDDVHLTVPPGPTTRRRQGIQRHSSRHDPDRRKVQGVWVTGPARTVMDVAVLPATTLTAAVCLADAAIRSGSVTPVELDAMAEKWAGRKGAVRVRDVARLARAGSRSCPETFARITLELAGMTFEPGYTILGPGGWTLYEGDLVDEQHLLWLEYDGYEVHTERQQFRKDRRRARAIPRRGWRVLPFTDEILANPSAFVAEIRLEVEAAPARIRGLPAGVSPEADAVRIRWLAS
ncbi:MAG: hypothetical protein QOE64_237 [Frankiales bacterium]|nr:hypothetical protein [Frankiales bacterium]